MRLTIALVVALSFALSVEVVPSLAADLTPLRDAATSRVGGARIPVDYAIDLTNIDSAHTGYLRVANALDLQPQEFTIEAWITPEGPGWGYGAGGPGAWGAAIVTKPRENAQGSYLLSWWLGWTPVNNKISFAVTYTYNSQGVTLTSNSSIAVGESAHVAAVFDGVSLELYINGDLDITAPYPYSQVYYGEEDILIGAGNFANPWLRRFDGMLDDIRIWNIAKTESAIAGGMNCRLLGSEEHLIAYWPFDNNSMNDHSGNGHDAVPEGVDGMVAFAVPTVALLPCIITAAPDAIQRFDMTAGPNPFNPRTTVSFTLPAAGQVQVAIYDAKGQIVARLVDETLAAGAHTVDWDGRDAFGASMPSGTYFCRLATADGVMTRKLQLIR